MWLWILWYRHAWFITLLHHEILSSFSLRGGEGDHFVPRGSLIDTGCNGLAKRNYGRLRFCHGYSYRNCAFNSYELTSPLTYSCPPWFLVGPQSTTRFLLYLSFRDTQPHPFVPRPPTVLSCPRRPSQTAADTNQDPTVCGCRACATI